MIQAIVYTSNTGSTERYAKLLGHETDLPAYSLEEAKKILKSGAQIIYLGWIMAGGIQGYREAEKRYQISMVCAVGMEPAGKQQRDVREKNNIPAEVELFTLQGATCAMIVLPDCIARMSWNICDLSAIAPNGQLTIHCPQDTHRSLSMTALPDSSLLIAPTPYAAAHGLT